MASSSPSQVSTSSPKQSPMSFDALTVSVSTLSDGLLERFEGDSDKAVDFLRRCQEVVEQKNTAESPAESIDLGDSLLQEPVVLSMMSPRGKVSLEFYEGYIVAKDVKSSTEAWRLPAEQVLHMIVFPKPEDCKKDLAKKSSDIVLLHLKEPMTVRNQKKPASQISFALPTSLPSWKEPAENPAQDLTVAWNQLLQRVLGVGVKVVRVHHPEAAAPSAFTSYQADRVSTTGGGMPFVTCYHRTKDGVLFPLSDGSLLFHKPPFLVPAEKLEGITTGGRGGINNSRYVDLVVQVQGEDTALEFTNVNRDEVEGLQKFLALTGDEEEEQEAVVVAEPDGETAGDSRTRSKRKASADARRINKRMVTTVPAFEEEDEEEDDIDYIAGEAVGDDEDTDDDDSNDQDENAGSDDDSMEEQEEDGFEMQIEGDNGDAETEDETESED